MEEIEERAETRVLDAIHWMEDHETETILLDSVEHQPAEYTSDIRLPEWELAAVRHGMHLFYAACEVQSNDVEELFHFVLLSRRETLSPAEVKQLVPGFIPACGPDTLFLRATA